MVETLYKIIPNKGTRLKGAIAFAGASIVLWGISVLMVKLGWFTVKNDAAMLWSAADMRWGMSTAFGFYAASETFVKAAESRINK